jgi:hypothetical protein
MSSAPGICRRATSSTTTRQIYGRDIGLEETVTVVRFSQVIETPHGGRFGNGEPPSRN